MDDDSYRPPDKNRTTKSHWFIIKSLSRRRNNRTKTTTTTTKLSSSSSSLTSLSTQTTTNNKENTTQNINSNNNNNCNNMNESHRSSSTTAPVVSKSASSNVLCILAKKCLNLKFLSSSSNDHSSSRHRHRDNILIDSHQQAAQQQQQQQMQQQQQYNNSSNIQQQQQHHGQLTVDRQQNQQQTAQSSTSSLSLSRLRSRGHETTIDGNLNNLLRHQLAVSNEYVEVPTGNSYCSPLRPILMRSHPIAMIRASVGEFIAANLGEGGDISQRSPISPWQLYPTTQNELAMLNAQILMTNYGWYRGSMSRSVAQKKLQGQPNGSFLLRNSQTNGYHFTLSFRSAGNTLHCRIEYSDGYWTIESVKYISIVDLIEDAMLQSKDHIFCYVKQSSHLQPPYPVRLTNPISKFDEVPSLQHICRYVIRCSDNLSIIECLPAKLQDYVKVNKYLNIRLDYFEDI